jgi:hypothetical protein
MIAEPAVLDAAPYRLTSPSPCRSSPLLLSERCRCAVIGSRADGTAPLYTSRLRTRVRREPLIPWLDRQPGPVAGRNGGQVAGRAEDV